MPDLVVPEFVASRRGTKTVRVLHAYRTYFPETQGGLEEVIRQICMHVKGHGIRSRVHTLSENPDPKTIRLPEADVYRSRKHVEVASCGMSFSAVGEFRRQVEWADVVHYHFPWPFADFLHFAGSVNKPTLLTYHSDIVRQKVLNALYAPLMNRFLSSVDRIVCTSPNYFATSEVLTRYASKVEIVPIGIGTGAEIHTDTSVRDSVRDEYGSDFFLFVGVLRYYKGLHILLEAVKDAPFEVVIAGSGPTEKELQLQAERLQLSNVRFAGQVSNEEKDALFELCRGVVFPSYLRSEAFGVTLLEGAMAGKPLISTEVGSGTTHVNEHGETGLVVTPGSPRALRQAMEQLWASPEEAAQMGRSARTRYERLFSGELMGSRYANIYHELSST